MWTENPLQMMWTVQIRSEFVPERFSSPMACLWWKVDWSISKRCDRDQSPKLWSYLEHSVMDEVGYWFLRSPNLYASNVWLLSRFEMVWFIWESQLSLRCFNVWSRTSLGLLSPRFCRTWLRVSQTILLQNTLLTSRFVIKAVKIKTCIPPFWFHGGFGQANTQGELF